MEVLKADVIVEVPWWQYFALGLGVVGVLVAVISSIIKDYNWTFVGIATIAVAIILALFSPQEIYTEKWRSTVEITELEYYKLFVQEGYTFNRIYDEREIYEIVGPEVEEGKG